jgi:hypothetical protein
VTSQNEAVTQPVNKTKNLDLKNSMAGYHTTLKKTFSLKSDNKPIEQASLAEGGKRKRWISPYIFGIILLLLKKLILNGFCCFNTPF